VKSAAFALTDSAGSSASCTAQYMDVGAAAGAFKKAGDKDFITFKNYSAHGAYPVAIAPEAVEAAFDVHETILAAVQGREGGGAHQFSFLEFRGADRADLGISGQACASGFPAAAGKAGETGDAYAEKKRIPKPE